MTTWIQHVKAVYSKGKAGGMSYKAALTAAAKTWKKGGSKDAATKKKGKKSKKKVEEEVVEEVKKKPKRRRKRMPKVPAKVFKNIDSISMPKKMWAPQVFVTTLLIFLGIAKRP